MQFDLYGLTVDEWGGHIMFGDLHCHTRLSDGSMGIDEVISYSKRMGINFLAITDHDTMAGVTRAGVIGARIGVNIIPGVEMSCFDYKNKRKVHILCYMPDKPERLEGICQKICDARKKSGLEMIQNVMKYYPVTAEHIAKYTNGSKSIYKQQIMNALVDLGYTDKIFSELYFKLFDKNDGICYVDHEYPDVLEVIDLIHSAGGIAVFAHPSTFNGIDLFCELAEKKLIDGVEYYHPRNKKDDMKIIKEVSSEYKLLITGGTDFHGMYASESQPLATCITPHEDIEALFAYKHNKNKGA